MIEWAVSEDGLAKVPGFESPLCETHIHPLETREHELWGLCWCTPQPEFSPIGILWTHNLLQ